MKKFMRLLVLALLVAGALWSGLFFADDVAVTTVQTVQTVDQDYTPIENGANTAADDPTDTVFVPDLDEYGTYDQKDDVALYILLYGRLPDNYITKAEAEAAGWSGGSVEKYCPGKCIGGGRFGNYEGLLPDAQGRTWTECDINTLGASSRGAERIVFSNDGLIYYTSDHYSSFELLYGEP